MKVVLPSLGVLGCREVDFKVPVYANLRELSLHNYGEDEIGYEFVKMLLSDPSDLDRMTFQDKDYLLTIAVAALHMNNISLDVKCPCGHSFKVSYVLGNQEVKELEEGTPKTIVKSCMGKEYSYSFLSASEERDVAKWAMDRSSEDPSKFRELYSEAFVCKTFGFPLTTEALQEVSNYNFHIYMSALLFREMCFHGVTNLVQTICPKCGAHLNVIVPFEKSLMSWSTQKVVSEFMRVSNFIGGFDAFLNLTISELEQMSADVEAGM